MISASAMAIFWRHREVGRHAAGEVDDLGLVLQIAVVGSVPHVFHPGGALVVVFGEDVPALLQVVPDHFDLLGDTAPEFTMSLRSAMPQVHQADSHRADFLAVGAERAPENRIAEVVQIFFGRALLAQKAGAGIRHGPSGPASAPACRHNADSSGSPGGGHGRAHPRAGLALGAGLHLQQLLERVVAVRHELRGLDELRDVLHQPLLHGFTPVDQVLDFSHVLGLDLVQPALRRSSPG